MTQSTTRDYEEWPLFLLVIMLESKIILAEVVQETEEQLQGSSLDGGRSSSDGRSEDSGIVLLME